MKRATIFLLASLAACAEPKPEPRPGPEKSRVIARGTRFEKADYILPGYVVILDLGADW